MTVPLEPRFTAPAAWTTAAPIDATRWGQAVLQVSGLGGGDTIAVAGSLDGASFAPQLAAAHDDLALVGVIAADGAYAVAGGAWLRWTQTGSASAPAVQVSFGPWLGLPALAVAPERTLALAAARQAGRQLAFAQARLGARTITLTE